MMPKTHHSRRGGQSGNIFFMLFASVALVGAFGVGASNVMKGLVSSMSDVTRKTIAEEKMVSGARISVQNSTTAVDEGDCDGDGMVEPLPYATTSGTFDITTHTRPVNGGYLPGNIGITANDPWGTPYGYCVWDPGDDTVSDAVAGCGGATPRRLQGRGADHTTTPGALTDIVVAVISAGKDRRFTTRCNGYVDTTPADGFADTPLVQIQAGGDDIVLDYNYNEVSGLAPNEDLWRVRDTKPDTATIDKDIEVGAVGGGNERNMSMEGVLELRRRGLLLPTDSETPPCVSSGVGNNDAELRINATASPPVLEICYDNAWTPVSMGNTAPPATGASCFFTDFALERFTGFSGNDMMVKASDTVMIGSARTGGSVCTIGTYDLVDPVGFAELDWETNCTNYGEPTDYDAHGDYIYAARSSGDSVAVVDISDPANLTYRGKVTDATNLDSVINVRYVSATHVAALSPTNDRLTMINVSTPTAPVVSGSVQSAMYLNNASIMAVKGNFAYVNSDDRITAIDLSNPASPTIEGSIQNAMFDEAGHMLIYDDYLYVMAPYDYQQQLAVIDISTPDAPSFVTSLDLQPYFGVGWTNSSVIAGWYLFMLDVDRNVVVVNLENPAAPVYETTLTDASMPTTHPYIAVHGQYMYVAGYESVDGTWIYDMGCDPLVGGVDGPDPVVSLPDPVVHLRLDDQTGTNVVDSRNNVTVTLQGATNPPTVKGVIGRAFDLDGTDDRLSIPSTPILNNLRQFTISFWIYGISSGSVQYLVDNDDTLALRRNDVSLTMGFQLGDTGDYITNETIPNNTWTHVALAFNGDDVATDPTAYINGVPATFSTSTNPSTYSSTGLWKIGSNFSNGQVNPGVFDDFRIYGQVLTPDQITLLYNDRSSTAYTAPNPLAILAANKYRGKISSGGAASCGIKEDSSLWCWGYSANGNLGNGTTGTPAVSPVRTVPNASYAQENAFVQLSIGQLTSGSSEHACAIKTDRTAWCWGADDYGQLGNGAVTTGDQSTLVLVSGSQLWTQISSGAEHVCGIDTTGALYCWGRDNYGQLGNGGATNQTTPMIITEPGPWVSVAAGISSTCAIKGDGSLWCWGRQVNGVLGNGLTANALIQDPLPVIEQGPWVKAARPNTHMCAVKLDGTLWCWGASANGKLGLGGGLSGSYGTPRRVSDLGPWLDVEVSQEGSHTCGIKMDGTAWCWGADNNDQLGNGASTSTQTSPVRVLDPGPWSAITLGDDFTCGIKVDGGAWCWGRETGSGQLGNGAAITGSQATPTRVENWPNVTPFALNDAQTLMTKATAATTIGLNQVGGRIGYDGNSGGFGFTGSGRSILANPNGNSGLSIESTGAYDSQISWKTVTGATTRSIGVDNATGNLEFGNNVAGVTSFMSTITPQMNVSSTGAVGIGAATTPAVKLDITGGGLRVGNDTRTCTISRKGVLRYASGAMQYCNGSAWVNF